MQAPPMRLPPAAAAVAADNSPRIMPYRDPALLQWVALLVALHLMDLVQTVIGLELVGCTEANPFMRGVWQGNVILFGLVKIAGALLTALTLIGFYTILALVVPVLLRWTRWVVVGMCIAMALLVAHNGWLIIHACLPTP